MHAVYLNGRKEEFGIGPITKEVTTRFSRVQDRHFGINRQKRCVKSNKIKSSLR